MEEKDQGIENSAQAEASKTPPINIAATLVICSSGWLIPGLSHVLLRRWRRGLIFAVCVLLMFGLGIAMDGKLYDLQFEQPLHIFAFLANAGAGFPYIVSEYLQVGVGTMTAPSYDYGTTFLWVCGLLNYLIVLDAFDIARGRKP